MDPLRPSSAPIAPSKTGADAARLAAQRAFFEMAMGKAGATTASPQPTAQGHAPAAVDRIPSPAQPAPERPLRPGSLLDIRV